MRLPRRFLPAVLLGVALILSACESPEERAEKFYQSALEFIEKGDYDRAIVELRNVFRNDKAHREARFTMAELQLEHFGNPRRAYAEYLRIAERYPEDLEARIALSRLAFLTGNWDELERHGEKAREIAPEDPRVRAITTARTYRDAALEGDTEGLDKTAGEVEALLGGLPDNMVLRSLVVDYAMRSEDYERALSGLDWMIDRDPDNGRYYEQRMGILAQLGDMDGIEAQLRDLIERFPDNKDYKTSLFRFYMSRNDVDQAERFLRDLAEASAPEDPAPTLDLIRFLVSSRSVEAARTEIDKAIAERADPVPFRIAGASLDFAEGNREEAVAALEAIVRDAEPSEQTRDARMSLARMFVAMDKQDDARNQVETVLAEEPGNPSALKLQAAWQIENDEADLAIAGLRTVLEKDPEDSEAMTLMAEAYTRSGSQELANDFLARAVEASGNAPDETLRYARVLVGKKSYLPAEDILIAALRRAPDNRNLLMMLGQVYLQMDDFDRTRQVAATLRRLGGDDALQMANQLEAEMLNRESGNAEAIAFLEQVANSTDASLGSKVMLVRARMSAGDNQGALKLAKDLAQDYPGNEALRVVLATAHLVNGNLIEAEKIYRDLLVVSADRPRIWLELSKVKQRQGDREAASAALVEGLRHAPDDETLLLARAIFLEQDGEIDAAIAAYEDLYARNSFSVIVANNLASLLSTHRDDPESLERAWNIARRFRDTEIPAMQDTYGWIAHRRGDSEEALPYLEAAAKAIPEEPLVHYHLGQAYLALERPVEARGAFLKVVETAALRGDTAAYVAEAGELAESLPATAPEDEEQPPEPATRP